MTKIPDETLEASINKKSISLLHASGGHPASFHPLTALLHHATLLLELPLGLLVLILLLGKLLLVLLLGDGCSDEEGRGQSLDGEAHAVVGVVV